MGVLRNFGTTLATLPLRLKMPKDRETWQHAAQLGTRELVFVTVPQANKASTISWRPARAAADVRSGTLLFS